MQINSDSSKKVVSEAEAIALVLPIIAFLQASGITQENADHTFKRAWNKALRAKTDVDVSKLANAHDYADIIGLWTKHPDFLDRNGLPRRLALRGPKGFGGLVKRVNPKLQPSQALRVLLQFGNAERNGVNAVKLVQRFFHVRSPNTLAFEPSARFLADASATVSNVLGTRVRRAAPTLFWRSAEIIDMPVSSIPAYIDFARSRSLVFLQDIDDWLRSHAKRRGSARCRRVGMGVFSICSRSDPS